MGTRVGTGGGVVGKDGGGAVLIRRRELRVPSSVKRCFVQKSITESRCKKKKKKKVRLKIYLSFSFLSFLSYFFFLFFFLEEKNSREKVPARINVIKCYVELGTFITLSFSLSRSKNISYIYIFFIIINFLSLDILSSRKMKRK